MKDLSMHITDIAQNSIRAGALLIEISIDIKQPENVLVFSVKDNGCGMPPEVVIQVIDPFVTSRTTRKVGLGLPFLKMNAEQSGGNIFIESRTGEGTIVRATFDLNNIDCIPTGDIAGAVSLLMGGNPNIDFVFSYNECEKLFVLKTTEVKKELDGISISNAKVIKFLNEMINENINPKPSTLN